MAAGVSTGASSETFRFLQNSFAGPKPTSITAPTMLFLPSIRRRAAVSRKRRMKTSFAVCLVMEDERDGATAEIESENLQSPEEMANQIGDLITAARVAEKLSRKRSERFTYLVAAVMSSFGITSLAVMSVYYRFSWQMEGGEVPWAEMFGTFALSVGAAVGMEFWARWAHRALWHASLWHMHESHHKPREGPFELNDVFAIINAVPAIALLSYGFFHKGLLPGLCFGAGLGITVFGMAYMFVHDGLVHKRFPVGPIAGVPYFRRVAAAHQLHHSDNFNGVPYGLFLGPKEIEEVGGHEELEKEVNRRIKSYSGS
ncbi:beta-carotene hydroxylase 2, chloroplastic-like isoform X2 [Malania oleifera]|uniref:beta-carotene hydroxylase 2, chloroplastic-like isoform X2 n=1 Tax=Malania oleifera TaxID=397392 RepID=UPI0025AEB909|nr:beta-carotene hydroxylase 2, chloroplastic-like isoform X2 [Malania oleifera]